VVGPQNADIADTLQLRDVAMATIFWLFIYGVHIGATWRIRLSRPCAVAMQPMSNYSEHLLWLPCVADADIIFSSCIFFFRGFFLA